MKTILLILAIAALLVSSAHAQNCAKKRTHRKVHKKAVVCRKVWKTTTVAAAPQPIEPCYTYRKHNIVVTECPSTFYDNSDIGALERGEFTGYYPKGNTPPKPVQLPVRAPQHTTLNSNNVVAPANGNSFVGY